MNRKIVIVDDDPKFVQQVVDVLTRERYIAITADTGTDAVAKVRSERPWLVVVGKELPDMTGERMLENLGVTATTKGTVFGVIMLCRPTKEELSRSTFGIRFYPDAPGMYLLKPFNPLELRLFVRQLHEQLQKNSSSRAAE